MSWSRLLGRILALVLSTTGALVAPGAATSSGATDAPVLSAVDTDGDGLDDSIDGCPTVASGTATGCPTVWRTVSLRWLAGKERLEARVSSPAGACVARARIKLFLDRPGRSDKLLASDASSQGRRRFSVPGGARYYAMVTPTYSTGVAECGKAVSRTVRVPR
ncbi:hypothetical protein [Nocardioides cavernae]|nr:hypothetical protein [Nocardioides cavernae]